LLSTGRDDGLNGERGSNRGKIERATSHKTSPLTHLPLRAKTAQPWGTPKGTSTEVATARKRLEGYYWSCERPSNCGVRGSKKGRNGRRGGAEEGKGARKREERSSTRPMLADRPKNASVGVGGKGGCRPKKARLGGREGVSFGGGGPPKVTLRAL